MSWLKLAEHDDAKRNVVEVAHIEENRALHRSDTTLGFLLSSMNAPLSDALARLFTRNLHTIKLGLEPVTGVLEELGNPQDSFLAVHVAGTNGKGSVVAMLASILGQTGLKVGMYTSPHLVRFNERIQINGNVIPDDELLRMMEVVEGGVARWMEKGGRDVTFFEFTTALAFAWFADKGVQVAVLETGMGGRLDATNVVTPAVSVITGIGLDHMKHLGPDVVSIAKEKAGIIKQGRPVICGPLPREAEPVIEGVAKEREAPLRRAEEVVTVQRVKQSVSGQVVRVSSAEGEQGQARLRFLGRQFLSNTGVAVAAALSLREDVGLPIRFEEILEGVTATRWPARTQMLSGSPPVLLDGAHNPQAAGALARTVHELWPRRPVGLLTGFVQDKDPAGFVTFFKSGLGACWVVGLETDRGMEVEEVQKELRLIGVEGEEGGELKAALLRAMHWAEEEQGVVVIAGSLYLAGGVGGLIEARRGWGVGSKRRGGVG